MIRRPGAILALLTGLNLLNYLDRLVVSAVLPKIQEELGLSNTMGGFLATVFLVGYFVTAPVFGWLGDRMSRKWLIALGVIVWSAATCASGLSTTAFTLVIARAFVGIGEASYATLAPTIIDDITAPQNKGRALSYFYSAMPLGAALGYLVGGFVEARWGWRAAFWVAGGPGLALALVCLLIAEPERKLSSAKVPWLKDLRTLLGTEMYRKAVLGYCAYTAAVGAFSYWAPKFLYQRYALPLEVANFRFGLVTVVAGGVATVVGGRWADAVRARIDEASTPESADRKTVLGLLRICALGSVAGAPLALACFLSPAPAPFFVFVFATIFSLFVCSSPINAVTLRAVPEELRASAMAFSIFAIHVFGDLWSPLAVGVIADHAPIQVAMSMLPLCIAFSAWLWWPPKTSSS